MKRIRIPEEDVQVSPSELDVISTVTFQRLFHLKQLGLAYLVYPGATQTRGAHSIRCLAEAQRILTSLLQRHTDIKDHVPAVRMAALLHDIGHLPFSHTLEDEHLVLLEKHDKSQRLSTILDRLKQEVQATTWEVVESALPILRGISKFPNSVPDWRSDLVGNTVCADLLAYITDDPAWTGISKRPGHYRLYDYFEIAKNRLCIRLTKGGLRNDVVSAIMDLLDMRYALTERVLFHHAKCTASAMLARSARLAGLYDTRELLELGDEGFLSHLDLLLRSPKLVQATGMASPLQGLRSRRFYKRIFKVGRLARESWDTNHKSSFADTWRDSSSVEQMLCRVEDEERIPRGSLAIWVPENKSGMKLARALVVWDNQSGPQGPHELRSLELKHDFPGVAKRVETIEDQYLDLWTCWVTVHPDHQARAGSIAVAIGRHLKIEPDSVFETTYLANRIPNYFETKVRTQEIHHSLLSLGREVDDRVAAQSALTGEATFDRSTVLPALLDVLKESDELKKHTGARKQRPDETGKQARRSKQNPGRSMFDPEEPTK